MVNQQDYTILLYSMSASQAAHSGQSCPSQGDRSDIKRPSHLPNTEPPTARLILMWSGNKDQTFSSDVKWDTLTSTIRWQKEWGATVGEGEGVVKKADTKLVAFLKYWKMMHFLTEDKKKHKPLKPMRFNQNRWRSISQISNAYLYEKWHSNSVSMKNKPI